MSAPTARHPSRASVTRRRYRCSLAVATGGRSGDGRIRVWDATHAFDSYHSDDLFESSPSHSAPSSSTPSSWRYRSPFCPGVPDAPSTQWMSDLPELDRIDSGQSEVHSLMVLRGSSVSPPLLVSGGPTGSESVRLWSMSSGRGSGGQHRDAEAGSEDPRLLCSLDGKHSWSIFSLLAIGNAKYPLLISGAQAETVVWSLRSALSDLYSNRAPQDVDAGEFFRSATQDSASLSRELEFGSVSLSSLGPKSPSLFLSGGELGQIWAVDALRGKVVRQVLGGVGASSVSSHDDDIMSMSSSSLRSVARSRSARAGQQHAAWSFGGDDVPIAGMGFVEERGVSVFAQGLAVAGIGDPLAGVGVKKGSSSGTAGPDYVFSYRHDTEITALSCFRSHGCMTGGGPSGSTPASDLVVVGDGQGRVVGIDVRKPDEALWRTELSPRGSSELEQVDALISIGVVGSRSFVAALSANRIFLLRDDGERESREVDAELGDVRCLCGPIHFHDCLRPLVPVDEGSSALVSPASHASPIYVFDENSLLLHRKSESLWRDVVYSRCSKELRESVDPGCPDRDVSIMWQKSDSSDRNNQITLRGDVVDGTGESLLFVGSPEFDHVMEPKDLKLIYRGEFKNGLRVGSGTEFHPVMPDEVFRGLFGDDLRASGEELALVMEGGYVRFTGDFENGLYSKGVLQRKVTTRKKKPGRFSLRRKKAVQEVTTMLPVLSLNGPFGCEYAEDGETVVFEGRYRNAARHGLGVEYRIEKKNKRVVSFSGLHRNGKRHGGGTAFIDGKKFCGVWENGELRRKMGVRDIPQLSSGIGALKKQMNESVLLGAGSFGRVYEVKIDGKKFAMKVIDCSSVDEMRFSVGNLLRRMHDLAPLVHPNVVSVRSWWHSDRPRPQIGYVMERCDGPVQHLIGENVKVLRTKKLHIATATADGLAYLERNDVVHGRLKWSNVLYSDNGDVIKVCVGDPAADPHSWLDHSAARLMQPIAFMSPEILRGSVLSSGPSDVYSFGLMLHCLFFETLNPFRGVRKCSGCRGGLFPFTFSEHVCEHDLRPPMNWTSMPGIAEWRSWFLVNLMHHCWARDPALRPRFAEIVEILRVLSKAESAAKSTRGCISTLSVRRRPPLEDWSSPLFTFAFVGASFADLLANLEARLGEPVADVFVWNQGAGHCVPLKNDLALARALQPRGKKVACDLIVRSVFGGEGLESRCDRED